MLLDEFEQENQKIADKAQQELENKIMDYQRLLLTETGQRIFEDLQHQFCMSPSYEPGMTLTDASFYEGQKSVIGYITRLLTHKPKDN